MKIPQLQAPIGSRSFAGGEQNAAKQWRQAHAHVPIPLAVVPRDCEPKGDGDNCTSGLAFSLQNLHHELLSRRSLLPGRQDRTLWNSREEAQNTQKTRRIVVQATYSVVSSPHGSLAGMQRAE